MYLALTLLILQGFGHVDAAKGDWHPGRATYFDAPQYWKDSFQPGKFGDLYGNSCQYVDRIQGVTPSNAEFPLPIDGVGAVTDVMPYNTGLSATENLTHSDTPRHPNISRVQARSLAG